MKEEHGTGLKLLLIIFGMLAFVMRLGIVQTSAATEQIEIQVEYNQDMARSIFDMINEYRTSGDAWYWNPDNSTKTECGYLSALQYDYDLEKVAMQRAAELAVLYDHMRPDGSNYSTAYDDCGYSWSTMGENIAVGYLSAESMHEGWMEENDLYEGQGHRRNILNSRFGSVGIACILSNSYYYWVEEFSGSCHNSSKTEVSSEMCTVSVLVETNGIEIAELAQNPYSHDIYNAYKDDGPANTLFEGLRYGWDVDWREYIGLYSGETIESPIIGCLFKYTAYSSLWFSMAVLNEKPKLSVADTSIAVIKDDRIEGVHCGVTELIAEIKGQKYEFPLIVGHRYNSMVIPATKDADGYEKSQCICCGKSEDKEVIAKIQSVELESAAKTYNGKSQKPKVIVKDRLGNVIDRSNYEVEYSNNKKVGTATVNVTFKGKYKGKQKLQFIINPKPVKISSVSTKNGVTVKWKKLTGQCEGYEIEYANNKSFTLNDGIAKAEGIKRTSRKLMFSKRNGTRYVRIRSYMVVDGKTYYSEWSDTYAYEY